MTEIPYDELQAFTTIVIEYAGSGDEGAIEDIRSEPEREGLEYGDTLYKELRECAYDILEGSYPGWEINEGSQGTITIHVQERKVMLHHGERVEDVRWHDEVEV